MENIIRVQYIYDIIVVILRKHLNMTFPEFGLRFLRCIFRVLRMLYITLNLKSLVINAKTLILHYNLYVDIRTCSPFTLRNLLFT